MDEFRAIIEDRWGRIRRELSKPGGYRPRINTKWDALCMNKYLQEVPEDKLIISTSGNMEDYLPTEARLLDYLTMETEGATGLKFPKLQDLRRFQEKRDYLWNVKTGRD